MGRDTRRRHVPAEPGSGEHRRHRDGSQYLTPWWEGPLSPKNNRGQTQFIPSNLMNFDSPGTKVANISDIAYMTVRLTETATGKHPKFSIVGQDGNPYTQVGRPVYGDRTTLSVRPGLAMQAR